MPPVSFSMHRPSAGAGTARAEVYMRTILCIATYFKGEAFLRECRRQGCRVLLLTADSLADAAWPRDAIDEIHTIRARPTEADSAGAVTTIARTACARAGSPRSTTSTSRPRRCCASTFRCRASAGRPRSRFRDKLAMRVTARDARPARARVHGVFNDQAVTDWAAASAAVGAEAAIVRPRRSASRRSRTATSCGARSKPPATRGPSACSSTSCPATSITSTRSSGAARSCSRSRSNTAGRRWKSRTTAAFSSRSGCPTIPTTARALLERNRQLQRRASALRRGVSHTEFIRARGRLLRVPRDIRARRRRVHRRTPSRRRPASTCGASGPRSTSPARTATTRRRLRQDYAGDRAVAGAAGEPDMSRVHRSRNRRAGSASRTTPA